MNFLKWFRKIPSCYYAVAALILIAPVGIVAIFAGDTVAAWSGRIVTVLLFVGYLAALNRVVQPAIPHKGWRWAFIVGNLYPLWAPFALLGVAIWKRCRGAGVFFGLYLVSSLLIVVLPPNYIPFAIMASLLCFFVGIIALYYELRSDDRNIFRHISRRDFFRYWVWVDAGAILLVTVIIWLTMAMAVAVLE